MKKLMILAGLILGLVFVNGCVTTGVVYTEPYPVYYRPGPVIFVHPHYYHPTPHFYHYHR